MLKDRLKSGSILLITAILAFFWSGAPGIIVFGLLGAFMLLNGLKEFFKFSEAIGIQGFPILTTVYVVALQGAAFTTLNGLSFMFKAPALITLVTITFIIHGFIEVFRSEDMKTGLHNLAISIFGYFYIGWTLSFAVQIFCLNGATHASRMLLLFMVLVTKSSDIGAYFVGSTLAKRPQGNKKIFPKLSPKKSWEGFFGGMATSAVVAVLLVLFLGNDLKAVRIISAIALAAVFTTVGFIGDIAESSFKRAGKLDDSGNILPGLGGAMDVLDSLIPVAPIFYAYLVLCS